MRWGRCRNDVLDTRGKQVGKAALAGWKFLAAAPRGSLRLWPFDGSLSELLVDGEGVVVAETYPREYYRHLRSEAAQPGLWSKTRQSDRLKWIPRLLKWAEELGVAFDLAVMNRIQKGFSAGINGEDEFDAIVGLLGMTAVLRGHVGSGEPTNDAAVGATEGWILGRSATEE